MKRFTSVIALLALMTAITSCGVKGPADGDSAANEATAAADSAETTAETAPAADTATEAADAAETATEAATEGEKVFYEVEEAPELGVSAGALEGVWYFNGNTESTKLTIFDGTPLEAKFAAQEPSGKTVSGKISLVYYIEDNGDKAYRFNFYNSKGALWNSFEIPQDIPVDDLYSPKDGTHFRLEGYLPDDEDEDTEEPTEETEDTEETTESTTKGTKKPSKASGETAKYVGTWGFSNVTVSVKSTGEDSATVNIVSEVSDGETYAWSYPCTYYPAGDYNLEQLYCDGEGTKTYTYIDENGESQTETISTWESAGFSINDYGYLVIYTDSYDFDSDWGFEKLS